MPTVYPHIYFPRNFRYFQQFESEDQAPDFDNGQAALKEWYAEALYVPTGVTPTTAWKWNTHWRQYRLNNSATYSIPSGGTGWSTTFSTWIGLNGTSITMDDDNYTYNTSTKLWQSPNAAMVLRAPTNPANYARFNYVAFFTRPGVAATGSGFDLFTNNFPVLNHIATWQETSAVTLAPGDTRTYNFNHKLGWRTRS